MTQISKYIKAILIICIVLVPCLLHAQPGGLGDDPGVDAPIDGGLSILLAAGAAYGIKKVKDNSKKKEK